jgi:hypothetical protein
VRVEARPQTGEGSVDSIDTIAEAPFYIASTGPRTPRRTIRHDDTFAVFDSHGDMGRQPEGPTDYSIMTRAICPVSNC